MATYVRAILLACDKGLFLTVTPIRRKKRLIIEVSALTPRSAERPIAEGLKRDGWAPRGERLVDKVPQGKWKTATFLAALRNDRIDAPCLFDGPINGERFHAYVEQFLVPTLKPGDVVILDNLGSHKGKAVRKAIRDVGGRLVFLPKYSPDLNPIEQVFAKFKTLLAKGRGAKLQSHLRLRRNPRPIPARRMRRIPQERRIRVDPKAGRSRPALTRPKTYAPRKTRLF